MKLIRALYVLAILLVIGVGSARADDTMTSAEKKPAAASKGMDMTATLEAKERAMQEAFKAKDVQAMMSNIDPNGWMADPSGFSPCSKLPDMIKGTDVKSYTLDGFKAQMVDKDCYIATYTWSGDASMNGQPYPAGPYYCSTVWSKRGKDWKAVYHQETMAMQPPSQPPPAADSH